MMQNWKEVYGPWALVTGASTGIGKSFCLKLAENGVNIVAVARNEVNLAELKNQLETDFNVRVVIISTDLSTPEGNMLVRDQTAELDIGMLIANAGTENDGPFIENDLEMECRLSVLNVQSPLILSHVFGKRFVERGKGGILLVSSLFGYQGVPYVANYSGSKAYILSFGEALNVELKPLGVDVTVLSPGMTNTPMTEKMPVDFNKMPISQHKPDFVAKVGLNALGRQATVVPGLLNKFYAWENRLIPRTWPVKLFGFLLNRARIIKTETVDKKRVSR